MRFLCDQMLGALAKWLRLLGYDTAYPTATEDSDLIRQATGEDRLLLTRDRQLAPRLEGAILIESDDPDEQLRQVVLTLGLTRAEALTRCSVCNGELTTVSPRALAGEVPPGVLEKQREFWRCPGCRRVYWRGSHYDAIVRAMSDITAATPTSGPPMTP